MAINFPTSPTNGDNHTFLGTKYTYNSTLDAWLPTVPGAGSSLGASADWEIFDNAGTLEFRYQGTSVGELSSVGALGVADDITAYR